MAKLKMLKMPKAPKLPKKPKLTASLEVKQKWLQRVNDTKAKYKSQTDATKKENAHRVKVNADSERLSKVISGISKIELFPRGFSAKPIRASGAKRKKAAPVKKKAAHKKAAHKKAAPKKAAKRRR